MLFKEIFLFHKLYNISLFSSPLTIKTTTLTRTYIEQPFAVLVPGVVVQLQVSQSTDQDLVAFQVHPADLARRFQQSLKLDNYYQA